VGAVPGFDPAGRHEKEHAADIGYDPADGQDTGRTYPGGSDNVVDMTQVLAVWPNEDPTEQSLQ